MVETFFHAPMIIGLFASVISLVGLVLVLYALYDVVFRQEQMETVERLIWVIVILAFNIFGVLIYFVLVWYSDERLGDYLPPGEERKLSELERLGELRDDGVLTEEEFQEEKARILGERERSTESTTDSERS